MRGPLGFPGPSTLENALGLFKHREFWLSHVNALRERYGDVVSVNLRGWKHMFFLPEDVRTVLEASHKVVVKGDSTQEFRFVQGNGPVLSTGEDWVRQRRMINPVLRPKTLQTFAPGILREVEAILELWSESARASEMRDLSRDMARLSFRVATRTLLGVELEAQTERFFQLTNQGMKATVRRASAPVTLPVWVPLPNNRSLLRVQRELNALTSEIVEQERRNPAGGFVSQLIARYAAEPSFPDVDQELRDQLLTMIIAGYETTAHALTWTWCLLARHPDIAARVEDEADRAEGNIQALVYTRQVLQETMRLFPPVPYITRKSTAPVEVAGTQFPEGSGLDVCIWSIHHDPRWWPQPERFDPDRFSPEESARRPAGTYLPFGAGPRVCAGMDFAWHEMLLAVSTLARNFRIELDTARPPKPHATVVIRPKNGLWARLLPREPSRRQTGTA